MLRAKDLRKNVFILQEGGFTHVPPTQPVFRPVLLHTEAFIWRHEDFFPLVYLFWFIKCIKYAKVKKIEMLNLNLYQIKVIICSMHMKCYCIKFWNTNDNMTYRGRRKDIEVCILSGLYVDQGLCAFVESLSKIFLDR